MQVPDQLSQVVDAISEDISHRRNYFVFRSLITPLEWFSNCSLRLRRLRFLGRGEIVRRDAQEEIVGEQCTSGRGIVHFKYLSSFLIAVDQYQAIHKMIPAGHNFINEKRNRQERTKQYRIERLLDLQTQLNSLNLNPK